KEKGVSGDAAVKFIKLAFSYEEWDVFDSAIELVVNFLQVQNDPTWKKAEMELKLLTLMQPLLFPGKFKQDFSISENNTKEARIFQNVIPYKKVKCDNVLFTLKIFGTVYILGFESVYICTCFYNYIVFSFQNIQPDEEILVDIIMFLWQKCKMGLQRIQMSGSDYLKYIHKYKAYQVLLYYNVFLFISICVHVYEYFKTILSAKPYLLL
uniref:Uncharacterized protein n=1 Tax=Athene cunicularia TaxID=194338 RepID=A0A663MIL0_ATHCN